MSNKNNEEKCEAKYSKERGYWKLSCGTAINHHKTLTGHKKQYCSFCGKELYFKNIEDFEYEDMDFKLKRT